MRCLAIVVAASAAGVAALGEPQDAGFALPEGFILVAHRGVVTDELTENSLPSLEETIRRGYTHIEVDVQCTKDGHPVCLHDANLKRTTGIDRSVHDTTLEELRALVSEETVPSLAAFCARCKGRIALMPDVKGYPPDQRDAFLAGIDEALTKNGLMASALFIGRPEIGRVFAGRARQSWRVPLDVAKRTKQVQREPGKRYFIFNHGEDFDAEAVKGFQAFGLEVVVSINTFHYRQGDPIAQGLADVKRMLEYGVDGLQIDSVYEPALR